MIDRPFLIDVTRLIARSWSRRWPTGIDRVAYAYLRHFGSQSHAVIQHRGVIRTLNSTQSDRLFAMLRGSDGQFRRKFASFVPLALTMSMRRFDGRGAFYLNVGDTDFDLASHANWVKACRLRPVYLLHDLIPVMHPGLCRPRAVARHRGRVMSALRTAAGIIVNSHATATDLRRFAGEVGLNTPSILPAPLAGAALGKQPSADGRSATYFVSVGTIEPRKNHMFLLKIWERLELEMGKATPQLIILGQWGALSEEVRDFLHSKPALREHVTVLSSCSDAEMARTVRGASALLMPTLAEGFGLPMVEALAMGTPVIASDLPCFREVGQGIPMLLGSRNAVAWEAVIRAFVEGCPERDRQLAMMKNFRPATWADHFSRVSTWLPTLPAWSREASTQDAAHAGSTMQLTA